MSLDITFSLKQFAHLSAGVLRPRSSNPGFFSLYPGQGLEILDYFLALFATGSFWWRNLFFNLCYISIWMGFHNLNTELPSATITAQPYLLLQVTMLVLQCYCYLFFLTLFPERLDSNWSGFSGKSACFWQYPGFSDQESMGAATASQKAMGVLC